MKGTLTLVNSKNPAVFETPMEIDFTVKPRLNEAFLFTSNRYGFCNTSTVNGIAVDSEAPGDVLITTRNSVYKLSIAEAK